MSEILDRAGIQVKSAFEAARMQMEQLSINRTSLMTLEENSSKQCIAFRVMLSGMDVEQFSPSDACKVHRSIEQWKNELVLRLDRLLEGYDGRYVPPNIRLKLVQSCVLGTQNHTTREASLAQFDAWIYPTHRPGE